MQVDRRIVRMTGLIEIYPLITIGVRPQLRLLQKWYSAWIIVYSEVTNQSTPETRRNQVNSDQIAFLSKSPPSCPKS